MAYSNPKAVRLPQTTTDPNPFCSMDSYKKQKIGVVILNPTYGDTTFPSTNTDNPSGYKHLPNLLDSSGNIISYGQVLEDDDAAQSGVKGLDPGDRTMRGQPTQLVSPVTAVNPQFVYFQSYTGYDSTGTDCKGPKFRYPGYNTGTSCGADLTSSDNLSTCNKFYKIATNTWQLVPVQKDGTTPAINLATGTLIDNAMKQCKIHTDTSTGSPVTVYETPDYSGSWTFKTDNVCCKFQGADKRGTPVYDYKCNWWKPVNAPPRYDNLGAQWSCTSNLTPDMIFKPLDYTNFGMGGVGTDKKMIMSGTATEIDMSRVKSIDYDNNTWTQNTTIPGTFYGFRIGDQDTCKSPPPPTPPPAPKCAQSCIPAPTTQCSSSADFYCPSSKICGDYTAAGC